MESAINHVGDLDSSSDLIIENQAGNPQVTRQPAPGVRVRRGLENPTRTLTPVYPTRNPHGFPNPWQSLPENPEMIFFGILFLPPLSQIVTLHNIAYN